MGSRGQRTTRYMGENDRKRESGRLHVSLRGAEAPMIASGVRPLIRSRTLMMMRSALLAFGFAAVLASGSGVIAQGMGVPRPEPVEAAPLSPPGGTSQPAAPPREGASSGRGVTLTQEPPASDAATAPTRSQNAAPAATGRSTLVPTPGDPMDVVEVTLPGKPAAVLSGESSWEEGFDNLKEAFTTIEGALAKAGLTPAGRPLAVFVETDDKGFRYEAIVPVDGAEGRPPLSSGIRFGRTPEGKAYHFVHKGPYENIDSTYETITAYLDAKGIVAKDVFIEEYVTEFTDRADDSFEINIFVQPQ